MDIYFDGADDGGTYSGTGGALAYSAGYHASIGSTDNCADGADRTFNGRVDDVRIYNRALSADDVKGLYLNSPRYCQNPDGVPGQLYYNNDSNVPVYCDGANWVSLAEPIEPTDGLVGYWKLDETSGTNAADSSGNGLDGTLGGSGGPTWLPTSGADGGAVQFTAPNSNRIDIGNPGELTNLTNEFTFAAWVWRDTYTRTAWETIYSAGGTDGQYWDLDLWTNGGPFIRPDDGSGNVFANGQIPLNTWTHITLVKRDTASNNVDWYFNGQYESTKTAPQTLTSNGDKTLGNRKEGAYDHPLHGRLDDVRMYDRPLSSAEIATLYNSTRPPALLNDLSLVGYWPLNEPAGSTIANDMAGDNIGYASGGVAFGSAGQIGGAATSVDDGDHIGIANPDSFDFGTADWTVTAWAKKINAGDYLQIMIKTDSGNWEAAGKQIYLADSGESYKVVVDAFGFTTVYSNTAINDTAWHFVAVTFNDTSDAIDIYLDGVPDGSGTVALTADDADHVMLIAGTPFLGRGTLDDVRIYSRALTAAEIDEIYQAGLLGLAAQDCANPNGIEGAIIYNLDENAPQYCDGAQWVRLGQ